MTPSTSSENVYLDDAGPAKQAGASNSHGSLIRKDHRMASPDRPMASALAVSQPRQRLGVVRIRKPGTIFLMGTTVSPLGLRGGDVVGVADCVADSIAGYYASRGRIVAAYVVGGAFQLVGFMPPIFLSAGDYLAARKDLFHLSDEAIQEYLGYVSRPVFAGAAALVAVLSLAGALVAARIIRRHVVKAGLVR